MASRIVTKDTDFDETHNRFRARETYRDEIIELASVLRDFLLVEEGVDIITIFKNIIYSDSNSAKQNSRDVSNFKITAHQMKLGSRVRGILSNEVLVKRFRETCHLNLQETMKDVISEASYILDYLAKGV